MKKMKGVARMKLRRMKHQKQKLVVWKYKQRRMLIMKSPRIFMR
jgi:hypothetical protein